TDSNAAARSATFGMRLGQAEGSRAAGEQSSPLDEKEESAASPKLEEVIVTAQKKKEKLQDVPSSITVLSGEKLIAQGVVQLSDYVKQVPGMNLVGATGPGGGQITMRGLSVGPGRDNSGVVGIFLDEVPFSPN